MKKIKKVLIANRGEVALRIIRTLKELDITAIAIYEKSDSDGYYLRFADETVMIGNQPVKDYLDVEKIIRTARECNADAVHPGYGFLSESAAFAEACEKSGILFIGPPSGVMRDLGSKVIAREIAVRAGIPTVPGTESLPPGPDGIALAAAFIDRHGYPVMLKATAAAGGASGGCPEGRI